MRKAPVILVCLLLMPGVAPRAAELIAACEQLEVAWPDSASREMGRRLAMRGCRAVLHLERLFAGAVSRPIHVDVCRDMEQWRRRSGRPWFVVAVLLDRGVLLQPPQSLRRVDAGRALEHELAHWFIRRRARGPLPRWLEEGLAQKLARQELSPGVVVATPVVSREQVQRLEQRLRNGHRSPGKMAADYAACRLLVDTLVRRVGMAALLEALPRLAAGGDVWRVSVGTIQLERLLFDW